MERAPFPNGQRQRADAVPSSAARTAFLAGGGSSADPGEQSDRTSLGKRGDIPQPFHLRALCQLYGKTAPEPGFPMQPPVFLEVTADGQTVNPAAFQGPEEPALTTFRQQHLLTRLMRMIMLLVKSAAGLAHNHTA